MTSEVGGPPQEPVAPAAPPAKSGFARLAGVLFAPVETFRDIARKPDILVPLAVIVLLGAIGAAIMVPRVDFETAIREQVAQTNQNLSKEDSERMVRMMAAAAKVLTYISPLITVVMIAIVAGILLLAFRLFGGEGNFKQAFSVTLYSWMPLVLQGIVGIIILFGRRNVSADELPKLVMSNLGFLADMKDSPVAFALLSSIDLFTIWALVLFILGFSAIALMSRAKSTVIVVSLWVVWVLAKVGFAALGAARAAA